VDTLWCDIHDMETHLHAPNSAPSYVAATKAQRPIQNPVKCTTAATKPTYVLKVSNTSKAVVPPTMHDSKGKAPALPPMDYKSVLSYDDDEYDKDYNPIKEQAAEAEALTSATGQLVSVILNGSVPTNTVGPSGSNSVERRVLEICPASMAEFHLTTRALEQAHAKDNAYKSNLLLLIRHYISMCHKVNPKMNVQHLSLNQWRAPEWAEKVKYDPQTGLVKPSSLTKEEDRNQRIQKDRDLPTKQAGLLLSVSNKLGLTVNGVSNS